jgi:hypothetical protein
MVAQTKERKPKSRWFDPRLGIGIVLVVASVVGVGWVVASADSGTLVYATKAALTAGERITPSDLVEREVRLGESVGRYLELGDLPKEGVIATRAIGPGELVARSSIGDSAGTRVASVVVSPTGDLAKSVIAGAVVELWTAEQVENGVFGAPTVLVSSATVVRLIEADGIIAGGGGSAVELLIPRSRTARVLEAIANEDAISLVPSSLPLAG